LDQLDRLHLSHQPDLWHQLDRLHLWHLSHQLDLSHR
jgi:hypothetical protein